MTLYLHNTLTRKKEEFKPLDSNNVRMYVCGPTVYGRAHLGNARSVVVYDVLYRLLRHVYGADHVTYVRNITDVDDKINAAAKERGITIRELTTEVTQWFHDDMNALNVLPAEAKMIEPKATGHIPQMIAMIEKLIGNGKAYVSGGHVLFSVASCELRVVSSTTPQPTTHNPQPPYYYGMLSGRIQEDLESGSRVKVESYKRDPNDFVLWKPADADDDPSSIFDSPWGRGRPGWHIECSAMSTHYLGKDFDIHGGGSDLMFPHHENEIAQSCGAYPGSHFARTWVHNGFLTVGGEKMSKSLGNFITARDLLDKGVKGEVIRVALLSTKYNEPLNWNDKLVDDAKKNLDNCYRFLTKVDLVSGEAQNEERKQFDVGCLNFLEDDLNLPGLIGNLYVIAANIKMGIIEHDHAGFLLHKYMNLIGLLKISPNEWFKGVLDDDFAIQSHINARIAAKKAKNWAEADRIRNELKSQGIILEDRPDSTSDWRRE